MGARDPALPALARSILAARESLKAQAGAPAAPRIARRGPADLGSAGERHEDRHARLRADLARDVTLASEVLGDEDVTGAKPPNGAVANLDVHPARQGEQRGSTGRM